MAIDPVGLTGLIIALVALLIALLQMMQALFATADGYRNCRPAIMGDWGDPKLTRRKFVPGEMRYETIYTVPYISMTDSMFMGTSLIDGTESSRADTYCTARSDSWWRMRNTTSEMVTWAFLLDQIHNLGAAYGKSVENAPGSREKAENLVLSYSIPTLAMRERSWDFTPSDVNKPLAVINLATIAILVRRLGMTWTAFDPSNSLLQAEGNRMVVNSVKVPAVGTVLEFNRAERRSYEMDQAELYIPGREIDSLGFGIIQPWYRGGDYFRLGTGEEYTETMLRLCGEGPTTLEIRDLIKSNSVIPGLADVVGLTAQIMFMKRIRINRVPEPSPNSRGILLSSPASMVFQQRLVKYISEHEHDIAKSDLTHLQWIQKSWADLSGLGAWSYEGFRLPINEEDQTFLNTLHDTMTTTESWLDEESQVLYERLLGRHVRMVVSCEEGLDKVLRENRQRPLPADAIGFANSDRECESMHRYVDYVEDFGNWEEFARTQWYQRVGTADRPFASRKMAEGVEQELAQRRTEIVVAWFTMIFRGLCWYQLHYMVPGPLVGSQHWDSQQSVYIT